MAMYRVCAGSENTKKLSIALHAQAFPSENLIVGSVMTTSGLKRALLRTENIRMVRIFYPFHYEGLFSEQWDALIIEGWFEMITSTIHEVRRISPNVMILYWCLDPDFPSLFNIMSLDVNGFLTNSKSVQAALLRVAPTELVYLAADLDDMAVSTHRWDARNRSNHLVYVGSALGISTKRNLLHMLREAALSEFGLELWGSGWDTVGPEDLRPFWRGVLPFGKLAHVYTNALAVLGATMDGQRSQGMVNNRVFEVLAVGTPLIQESINNIDNLFNMNGSTCSNLFLWEKPGDVLNHSRALSRRDPSAVQSCQLQSHRHIRIHHTYDRRAMQILNFIEKISSFSSDPYDRHNHLRVLILFHQYLPSESNIRELFRFHQSQYTLYLLSSMHTVDASVLLDFDIIITLGNIGDPSDLLLRQIPTDYTMAKGITQRRILLPLCLFSDPKHSTSNDIDFENFMSKPVLEAAHRFYDVIGYNSICKNQQMRRRNVSQILNFDNLLNAKNDDTKTADEVRIEYHTSYWNQHYISNSIMQYERPAYSKYIPSSSFTLTLPATERPPKTYDDRRSRSAYRWLWQDEIEQHQTTVPPRFSDRQRHDLPIFESSLRQRIFSDLPYIITRSLCLGRGMSSVHIIWPPNNFHLLLHDKIIKFPFKIDIRAFDVGRDGSWCLIANPGGQVTCILQNQFQLVLQVIPPEHFLCSATVHFHVELRSNVYSDVIAVSDTVSVIFRSSSRAHTTEQKLDDSHLAWLYKPPYICGE